MAVQTIIREGRLAPDQEKTYFHVPFDVPPGAQRLDVSYHYDARISSDPTVSGGNTIDLGVFDERGIDFLQAGFRGWSGSERDTFFITPQAATPGYLAGPLNPGRWHALLGLYKIAPGGCHYQVSVTITTGDDSNAPAAPAKAQDGDLPASRPPAPDRHWLRGDLHCHTWHSDGVFSPADLVAHARERGLDFLAVSDHNTTAAQHELEGLENPGLVLIRGVESTTFKGHFNVWGIPDWIDFRVTRPEEMRAVLQFANARGGLTSCGHPKPYGPDWDFREVDDFHCVEVWNGPWNGLDEASLEYWLALLANGARKPAVGGSDYHRPGEQSGGVARDLATPVNWVYVPGEPTAAAVLDAVRRGHVSLSDQPDGPFLDLCACVGAGTGAGALPGDGLARPASGSLAVQVCAERGTGLILRLLDQRGILWEGLLDGPAAQMELSLAVAGSRYVRAELRDADERMRAMTNPLYLD